MLSMTKKAMPTAYPNHNNSEEFKRAQSYILRLLAIRLRTEKETTSKLEDKSFSKDTIEKLISKLKETGLINDEIFTKLWIESRKNLKNKSNFIIKQELKVKGVSDDIIRKYLYDNSEYTDLDSAKKLLARKSHLFQRKVGKEKILKQQQFLARNGFSWETIKKVVESNNSINKT